MPTNQGHRREHLCRMMLDRRDHHMNMKTKIASIMGAAIMAVGVAAPALAQQTGEVPIDVQVGTAPDATLAYSMVMTSEFPAVPFSLDAQQSTGAIAVTVTDTRGTAQGWSLSVSATDFFPASTSNPMTIPIENLTAAPGPVSVVTGQPSPLPTANTFVMSESPQVLFTAAPGSGNGRYATVINGSLVIPGATRVDTYTSTITVSLISAP
jgi:hypothetical protein